jgi:CheY-like chemotaxis protein
MRLLQRWMTQLQIGPLARLLEEDGHAAVAPPASRAGEAAEPGERARNELLAMLSHELRTPLGALSAANDVLQTVPPGSADAREALAVISRQTARLSQLLHELSTRDLRPAHAAPPAAGAEVLPPSRRRKVLVIEDNSNALASLRCELELDGHMVSTADDGAEGLSRLLQQRPEVSIIDIGLPGLTGFDLARHARASGYSGRLIALSGWGSGQDARDARVAGFDDCLVLPVDRSRLRASIGAD